MQRSLPHLRLRLGALLACCVMLVSAARADIYKYVDKQGHVYLTDQPDHPGYKLLMRTWKGWVPRRNVDLAKARRKYSPTIRKVAKNHRLPDALLHAVITAESAYDPNAVSSKGAVGLMQLMPSTARRYGVQNRRDPVANMNAGAQYLKDLLATFNNNLPLALAAYNAGENAVTQYGNRIPPYYETRHYVAKVLQYYRQYLASGNL